MKVTGLNLHARRPVQIMSLTLPSPLQRARRPGHIPVSPWSNYADLKDHAAPTDQELHGFAIVDLASHDE
jgi:hypothetical protein